MNVLSARQEILLHAIGGSELGGDFFLTGGTALSAFYLQHRVSEDLDFFTENPAAVTGALPILLKLAQDLNGEVQVKRSFRTYLELLFKLEGELIRCDFAQDSPYRLSDRVFNYNYGIYVDNALDIACNKLSALYDRAEPKDFVDVYFIDKELFPLASILESARKKHVGIDDYWLSVAFLEVNKVTFLPKLLKPVNISELRTFFEREARKLMSK
ncbi:MAG: nucleotidyl transferase AbiEii/AbiGii toxin family protein [Firmicutes bacterium]|nr:nucleotidyl transferase AbiEii/AbiGii toxin family protein [Bacillota bacterium]